VSTDVHHYRYRRASTLTDAGLLLETSGGSTDRGLPANPRFFAGFLVAAERTAAGMLVLADLARADFRRSGAERVFRDPILTSDGSRLRMESFSACCGGYARLDVLDPALDGEVLACGTTNVDVNPPLYRALTRIGAGDPLRMSVGLDELMVATLDGVVIERKVPLPDRWLRGLAEVPAVAAGLDQRAELGTAEAAAFLSRLPRASERGVRWLLPAGRSLRTTTTPVAGAVCLADAHRLGVVRPLLPFTRALRIYGPVAGHGAGPLASGWELDLGDQRFTLLLSPDTYRGFSGEGGLLHALAGDRATDDAELVGERLSWTGPVDIGRLSEETGLDRERVSGALAALATCGRVGYDCAEVGYFRRELPYDASRIDQLNPRMAAARALAAAGQVQATPTGYEVRSADRTYLVHHAIDGRWGCTCAWWTDYQGGRGPCKHVLAATRYLPSTVEDRS
jgi:hypothetical protein